MRERSVLASAAVLLTLLFPVSTYAFHNGGLVELSSHQFTWTDPASGGRIVLVVEVFEGCMGVDPLGVPF